MVYISKIWYLFVIQARTSRIHGQETPKTWAKMRRQWFRFLITFDYVVLLTYFLRQKFDDLIEFSKIQFIFQNIIYPKDKTPRPWVTPKSSNYYNIPKVSNSVTVRIQNSVILVYYRLYMFLKNSGAYGGPLDLRQDQKNTVIGSKFVKKL